MKNCLVTKIVIDNGAASGIEVRKNGISQIIDCERELVLSAGAFNTPQLLMLSGIGDAAEIRRHDIDLVADVHDVGCNLENHPGVNLQYATNYEDSLVSQLNYAGRAKLGLDWLMRKKGLGTSNYFETGAFLRSREDVAFPNLQFEFLPLTRYVKNGRLVAIPGFQFWLDLSRPKSRGSVKLRSGNPADPPSILFNHLDSRQDIRDLIDGIRIARDMIAQPAWDKYRGEELAPGADIRTDEELEAFIRANLGSSYHPSGTCRMGNHPEAVVDSEGKVRAVRRLRIVDASIMPRIVTANLSASIMMMAEKITDRILDRPPLPPCSAPVFKAID